MAKRKQITLYVNTKKYWYGDIDHTQVKTYKEAIADIYLIDEGNSDGFRYSVLWNRLLWSEETFSTEIEAIRFICRMRNLYAKYETILLRYGNYTNSEQGAITWKENIIKL